MDKNKYLEKVLKSQILSENGDEIKALKKRRKEVESLLRDKFGSAPTIRYGGSKAKGTMIKESYDLDITCYFPHDSTTAGETLEEIYDETYTALSNSYLVEKKGSALRLKGRGEEDLGIDFHIDVVPGRYVDDSNTDTFLFQTTGGKKRLKTNLDVHIDHVKDSKVQNAIRLIKLWKIRRGINLKTFVLELLVIKLLESMKDATLSDQLEYVWTIFRDQNEPISVEDPANPTGNSLTEMLDAVIWSMLSSVADGTLYQIENDGWNSVFGQVDENDEDDKSSKLYQAAVISGTGTKPWYNGV